MNIVRKTLIESIQAALGRSRVVVLAGPRQCGKTTLARELLSEDSINYFDLEDPASLARLEEPMTGLRSLEGLVVIDEVQRRPDLFPVLRVLADRNPASARFLILGSASGDLLRQTSESLAGRMEQILIGGFTLGELGAQAEAALWLRGGFPLSYLAGRKRIVWLGARISSERCLSAICHNGVFGCPRWPCIVFGPCLRIIMVRPGTPPSRRGQDRKSVV